MNELASIELVVTTEDLDKAIALLLTFRWEALYQDVLHAFILERDRRKLGSPARAIVLARQRVDELPPDVKAALISRHEFSHVRRSPSTRPMNEPRPTSFTILVIDDDPGLLEVATELLSGKGHRVLVASSGEDALAMIRAVHPDLILLDYFMPKMNGLEVLRQLKADAKTRESPVVAMTSGAADEANALSEAGCVAFIPKPFEPREFLRLIAGILRETVGRIRRPRE